MKQIVCTILLPCRSLQIELTYVNNLFKAFLCAAVKSKGFYSYFSKLFIFLFDAVIDKVKKITSLYCSTLHDYLAPVCYCKLG